MSLFGFGADGGNRTRDCFKNIAFWLILLFAKVSLWGKFFRSPKTPLCAGRFRGPRFVEVASVKKNSGIHPVVLILELMAGIGPATSTLPRWCYTTKPHQQNILTNLLYPKILQLSIHLKKIFIVIVF